MTVPRIRPALLGALLAMLAVLGLVALSTWHGSNVHEEDPVHAASIRHVHGAPLENDPDGAIHVAAHMTGQGLSIPSAAVPRGRLALRVTNWPILPATTLSGLDPGAILRPPRA